MMEILAVACVVGILFPVFSFLGPDAATYMAEELRDASRSLPRAMMWTALVNGGMGFVMIITFMMMLGDPEVALDSPTGYPFIDVSWTPSHLMTALCLHIFQLFYRMTGSLAATTVMVSLFFIMLLFGCVTSFATSSRQMWAFVSTYRQACHSIYQHHPGKRSRHTLLRLVISRSPRL
jgi:choline transport protein